MSDDTTLEERARGMLLGLACCDALGTTNEFLPREETLRLAGIVGGGPFELDAGKWTDDTSMALCLADALLDTGRYDSEAVMNAYADWRFRGRRSSTGKCFDIGAQVAAAIDGFLESRGALISVSEPRTDSAGNGCIMRLAPVIIAGFASRRPGDIVKMARVSARETHYSFEAEAATEVFAALLVNAMRGLRKDAIIEVSWARRGRGPHDGIRHPRPCTGRARAHGLRLLRIGRPGDREPRRRCGYQRGDLRTARRRPLRGRGDPPDLEGDRLRGRGDPLPRR